MSENAADIDPGIEFSGDSTQPIEEPTLSPIKPKSEPDEERHDELVPPQSEYDLLWAQLREKPQNPEDWKKLVDLAESSGDLEKVKQSYEALLERYPNTAAAQIAYLNHFLNPPSFQFAESLFKRFLRTSPSVELWKFYLTYVRRVNTGPAQRDTIRKAYEFALNHVGQDKDGGEIWSDYIQFLKSGECTTTWEEQQKMDALRKVYHRAVQIPLDNVEKIWQELEAFETNLNKITAKKFMSDLTPAHMQARAVLRQLQKHLAPLFPPTPPSASNRPPLYLPALPTFNVAERALVGSWKAYLKWEESNPLEVEDKDKATLITRVQGVYRKAVIRMRFYSEIWFMAYTWTLSIGKQDEAMAILKQGMEANPGSFLLTFAYVEAQEVKKEYPDVHTSFDKLLTHLRTELEVLEARVNSANSSLSSLNSNSSIIASATMNAASTGLTEAGIQSNNSSFATQASDEKPPKSQELSERRTEYGLVWIMYMRFGRRAESVKVSRGIFGKARKDRWTPWQVYEAAALMEYHCSNDKNVASRIFEKGLDTFGDEIEYVLRYLGFLISVNDQNNARALFERVISTFSPEEARKLWERWARYEYQYGDLEAAQKLEKRMAEVYPSDPPIKRFAQRHIYLGIDAIAAMDLGVAKARISPNSLTRTETQGSLTQPSPATHKRASSPEYRKDGSGRDHKRARPLSPRGDRGSDRDGRWDGPGRRRFSPPPPAWERDGGRDRDGPPPPPPRRPDREREDEKGPVLPPVISWFVGQLPAPSAFDGPVFRTDDLMMLFRNAVIPSSSGARARSPPPVPPPRGRPPPDYGPYQGPGGRGARRY